MVVFQINIYGTDKKIAVKGKVAGFSDRITSVLVPQSFMNWAERQSSGIIAEKKVSRVILKVKDAGSTAMTGYLKNHGLTADAGKIRFSRYKTIVDWVVRLILIIGLCFLIFSLLVFVLLVRLVITAGRQEIFLLLYLGASPRKLKKYIVSGLVPYLITCIISVLAISEIMQVLFAEKVKVFFDFTIPEHISFITFGAAVFICVIVYGVIISTVKRSLFKNLLIS
jgi:hypothetical protein